MPVTRCSLTNDSSSLSHVTNQRRVLPDPLKHGGLPGGAALAVHLEAVHVSEAENGGGHTPGQPQQGAHPHHQPDHQHVQVVAAALLQLVLLPVDDDGGDLLVHEQQHGEEEGGEGGQEVNVPGGLIIKHGDQPIPDVRASGLKIVI